MASKAHKEKDFAHLQKPWFYFYVSNPLKSFWWNVGDPRKKNGSVG